jgi:4-amino-4-deoxy-L-arabinose transferase-like glycosyltransferase
VQTDPAFLMKHPFRRLEIILLVILGLQLALLVISVPGQRIHGDEAVFAEFAYFQAQDGFPRSELFRGFLDYDTRIFIYHKFFQWVGAAVVWLFGFGAWPLRSTSLVAGVILIYLLYRHMSRDQSLGGRTGFLMAVAFLALAPLTFKFVKFYRPEVWLAATGLGSYMALQRGLERGRLKWVMTAGALAGLAMLTHLNGAIYVAAGTVVLLSRKKWGPTVAFSVAAMAVFSLYFVDIVGHFGQFWYQYAGDPSFSEGERTIVGSLVKLLDEHKRLFRKPEIIFTSALFFISAAISLWRGGSRHRDFYVYTATCIVVLGAVAPAKTTPYAILLFPFFAIEIGRLAAAFWPSRGTFPKLARYGLIAATVFFIANSVVEDSLNAFAGKQHWVADNRRLAALIPPHTNVLAPLDFVWDELPNYRIAGWRVADWRLSDFGRKSYTIDNVAAYADSLQIPTIILDREPRDLLGLQNASVGDKYAGYKVVAHFKVLACVVLRKEAGAEFAARQ